MPRSLDEYAPEVFMAHANSTHTALRDNMDEGDSTHVGVPSNLQTPAQRKPKTFTDLPRELRDRIYGLCFLFAGKQPIVIFARPGHRPSDFEGPIDPEMTAQVATKHHILYPGSYATFSNSRTTAISDTTLPRLIAEKPEGDPTTYIGDEDVTSFSQAMKSTIEPSTTSLFRNGLRQIDALAAPNAIQATATVTTRTNWKNSLTGILYTNKQISSEAVPYLYESCTFFFEDLNLSSKFFEIAGPKNLGNVLKIAIYYPEELETVHLPTEVTAEPDQLTASLQGNKTTDASMVDAIDSDASSGDLGDDQQDEQEDLGGLGHLTQPHFPPNVVGHSPDLGVSNGTAMRKRFGLLCEQIVTSTPKIKELTVWIGKTLELEYEGCRSETYEKALLQLARLEKLEEVDAMKFGDAIDNSGDEGSRWHETQWDHTTRGVKEMIATGDQTALDRMHNAFEEDN